MGVVSKSEKARRYKFKNNVAFSSVDEMQSHIYKNGAKFRLSSEDSEVLSGVLSGNCVVLQRSFPCSVKMINCYFVGATGHVEVIRESMGRSKTLESAVSYLESKDFNENKINILSENDLPLCEHDRQFLSEMECEVEGILQLHDNFMEKYLSFIQTHESDDSLTV